MKANLCNRLVTFVLVLCFLLLHPAPPAKADPKPDSIVAPCAVVVAGIIIGWAVYKICKKLKKITLPALPPEEDPPPPPPATNVPPVLINPTNRPPPPTGHHVLSNSSTPVPDAADPSGESQDNYVIYALPQPIPFDASQWISAIDSTSPRLISGVFNAISRSKIQCSTNLVNWTTRYTLVSYHCTSTTTNSPDPSPGTTILATLLNVYPGDYGAQSVPISSAYWDDQGTVNTYLPMLELYDETKPKQFFRTVDY